MAAMFGKILHHSELHTALFSSAIFTDHRLRRKAMARAARPSSLLAGSRRSSAPDEAQWQIIKYALSVHLLHTRNKSYEIAGHHAMVLVYNRICYTRIQALLRQT
jgi:hypothetical protein